MALSETSCPRCGKSLGSDPAVASGCPRCGGAGAAPGRPPAEREATAGRLRRTALIGGLAVVVIGVVAAATYPIVRQELGRSRIAAATQARPRQGGANGPAAASADEPDSGEVRTPLAVLHTGKDGTVKTVVSLGRPIGPKTTDILGGAKQATLLRELIRQAVLIAARDELGLSTRDEVLDDVSPEKAEVEGVELATLVRPGGTRALIRRRDSGRTESLLKLDLGQNPTELSYSGRLAVLAEQQSRTEFPGVLKKIGLTGEPNKFSELAPVPPDVEQRLEGLSLVDHFGAIRALHDLFRTNGESPARLAALARAYAQLGALTEYQWSPAHRVFKARAMLYVERLRARDPKSPWATWNRAFVRTLLGFHAEALEDLAEAKVQAEAAKDAASAPSWAPVLDAFLKNDPTRLDFKNGPNAKLAALLKMMNSEFPGYTRTAVMAARDVLNVDGDCWRAYDSICVSGQLGDMHFATKRGPEAFTEFLPVKLRALPFLPRAVRQSLDDNHDELSLVDAMAKAGRPGDDQGEPSWGVLAQLIREVRFMQIGRRLIFMAKKWSVPVDGYWADVEPFVAHHRYFAYLQSFTLRPGQARETLARFLDGFDPTDIETNELPLVLRIRELGVPMGQPLWAFCAAHCETGARDVAAILAGSAQKKAPTANVLLKISPYSAFAMANLIEHDWENSASEVASWKEKVRDDPTLLGALGKKYVELKKFDEAEKCLARYVEQSPDPWAIEALADCFLARGDGARWKATLDDYIANTEDAGLEHARVRVKIADDLMKNGHYAEAWPYAQAAASTWASWAMTCAQNCAEGLKNWQIAEGYARASAERYPGSMWTVWFVFCERTGHGDIAAARAWTKELSAGLLENSELSTDDLILISFVQILCGDKAIAAQALRRIPRDLNNHIHMVSLAAFSDLAADKAVRDAALERFCTSFQKTAPKTAGILQMIRNAIAAQKADSLDLKAIDEILESMPKDSRGNSAFPIAAHLTASGRRDESKRYWLMTSEGDTTNFWWRVIALSTLREMNPQDSGEKKAPGEIK